MKELNIEECHHRINSNRFLNASAPMKEMNKPIETDDLKSTSFQEETDRPQITNAVEKVDGCQHIFRNLNFYNSEFNKNIGI